MELFRQWGIQQRIHDRGLQDGSDMFVFVESIAGREIGRTRPEPNEGHTPAWKSLVAQDAVEEEIYAELQGSRHARVLFNTEFLGFEETPDGVSVHTASTGNGADQWWDARYLVAADGAGSHTRRTAGIEMQGPATLAVMSNEYWKGDLSRFPITREAAGYRIISDSPGGRFPHMWLDLARKQSTLDWFDKTFTLVAGPLGSEWPEAGKQAAAKLGLPIGLRMMPRVDEAAGFRMGMRGAVLVRPDGHVAWRMPYLPSDAAVDIAMAMTTLLRSAPV